MTTHEQAIKEVEKNIAILEQAKKYEKILEILKSKQVDIHNLLNSKTCEEYNGFVHWLGYKGNLIQEEYDLLREELKK